MSVAAVKLWGKTIGAVSMKEGRDVASFQYDEDFAASGLEVAPLMMPLSTKVYEFSTLARNTFHGLPGLLADSLPDKFGNALVDAWLATQGRAAESFGPIDRLCYTGTRGMGALEYAPQKGPRTARSKAIELEALTELASEVLKHRNDLRGHFHEGTKAKALNDILRVGTSAGGARAKAVIAWNRETNEVRSGQIDAGDGFEYWMLKFDGVKGNKDKELDDQKGYGRIEYAYYLMAKAAGITMSDCRLLEENGRHHFMTKRFDRVDGKKLHMQSLCAMAHFDFNMAGAYSYDQAVMTIRQLNLPMSAIEEQFRRMLFNVLARNQDDHVKNIAFLMNKEGEWSLSPAFDVTYSYNPTGIWTGSHQMAINGKRDHFLMEDFEEFANRAGMKRGRCAHIFEEVRESVMNWTEYAGMAGVDEQTQLKIRNAHRREFSTK